MFIPKLNKHLGHDRMRDPHLNHVYNYMLLNTVLFCKRTITQACYAISYLIFK